MSANLEKVYDYIEKHFDEHVENVRRLVRQPSISFTNEGVEKCADMLVQAIKDLGGQRAERCDFKDGFPVVYGELMSKNPNAKTIIVYTLYDVMPVDEEGWKVPPFSAEILEGTEIGLPQDYGKVVVGRGARNQKGPIVAFMNSVKAWMRKSTQRRKFGSVKSPSRSSFRASRPVFALKAATVWSSKLDQVCSQLSK